MTPPINDTPASQAPKDVARPRLHALPSAVTFPPPAPSGARGGVDAQQLRQYQLAAADHATHQAQEQAAVVADARDREHAEQRESAATARYLVECRSWRAVAASRRSTALLNLLYGVMTGALATLAVFAAARATRYTPRPPTATEVR